MTIETEAAGRLRRIKACVEKSQDIYAVDVDESRQSIHAAGTLVKRMMLDDERTVIDAYLRETDTRPITEEFARSVAVGDKHNPNWTAYYLFESADNRMGDVWLRHWSTEFATNGREWIIENEQGDSVSVTTIAQFYKARDLFGVKLKGE